MKLCSKCDKEKPLSEFNKWKKSKDGHNYSCRECIRLYYSKYRVKNKDKIKKLQKAYEKRNHNKLLKKAKEYRNNNKDKIKASFKKYYNTEYGKNRIKEYHKRHSQLPETKAKYRANYLKNKDKISNYKLQWITEKLKSDPKYIAIYAARSLICASLKSIKRKMKNRELYSIGCSLVDLKIHIESKFKLGMTWENHGRGGWHLDHIIPLTSEHSKEEILKLNHYTNLQPLWESENLSKWAHHK